MMIANIGLMLVMYVLFASVTVLATLLTWLFAISGILPALSFTTKDGNLPKWCYWLQTHDNPLDGLWLGDEGASHRKNDANDYKWLYRYTNEQIAQSFWLKFFARMLWLVRNPAYGVANLFGLNKAGLVELFNVERERWSFVLFKTAGGTYGFKFYGMFPWAFNRSLRMYLGWKHVGQEKRLMLATHVNPFRKSK